MAADLPTILSSENNSSSGVVQEEERPSFPIKKIIIILLALVLVIGGIIFLVIKILSATKEPEVKIEEIASSSIPVLPNYENQADEDASILATSTDMKIEYISFSDYYIKPDNSIQADFENYSLPLNAKIDIINYYDISRKMNLDPGLDDLNNHGFALINNPWPSEAKDFYSAYKSLSSKQVPLLITSDFIVYYYQNILKKVFKDIEENIFYDNLWDINKTMYEVAKKRYEARLSSIGNVNDPLLEGARLETVFFAVSLELLKPITGQIAESGVKVDSEKFTVGELNKFSFVVPDFLAADVAAEVKLIRNANGLSKSPIFLYIKDYAEFKVPEDYRGNAKLNNFYLTSKWLNSVFPLYYRSESCPGCLLDREDWRVNMVATILISDDFSSLPQLKNRWARIYKVISFFKGLRDDLDYVHYRDALYKVFGDNYNIEELFKGENQDYQANLDKFAAAISSYNFSEIQGGPSESDLNAKVNIGFKMLASSYFPDTYLFNRLTYPSVGAYLGKTQNSLNTTLCEYYNPKRRCNGSNLDILNLVYPILNNPYFVENINYVDYDKQSNSLRREISTSVEKHTTNYWSTLGIIKNLMEVDKTTMPIYARLPEWESYYLSSAAAMWANMHLPFDKFVVKESFNGRGFNDFSSWIEYSYVEPNLSLINELLANNKMIADMLSILQVNMEVRQAFQEIQNSSSNLENLKRIIKKEISGEELDSTDIEDVFNFAGQLEITAINNNKIVSWALPNGNKTIKADLSNLRFMVLINQKKGNKFFSVGPVWDYKEIR